MFKILLTPSFFQFRHGFLRPLLLALQALLLLGPNAWAEPQVVDRITAVVNDDIISLFELNQAMKPYLEKMASLGYPPEQEAAARAKLREEILNQLIDRKLTDQEIKRLNITVSEKEVESTLERIKARGFSTDEDLAEALKSRGLTLEEYRTQMREQILRTKLVNMEVKSKIVITQEDIENYYQTHSDEYRFEKSYHLRHILLSIPPLAGKSEKAVVQRKMQSIRNEAASGKSFADLAMAYSEAPTAENGGYLGEFEFKEMNEVMQSLLRNMKAGDITEVLETGQGYQLFYVEKITSASERSMEEATPEIQEKLYEEVINKEFQSWLSELRKKSVIKIVY